MSSSSLGRREVKMIQQTTVDRVADAAAGVSVTAAAVTWLENANGIAQLVGTCVAILSGLAALGYHVWKWNREVRKAREERGD
jgi:hypothetical protein